MRWNRIRTLPFPARGLLSVATILLLLNRVVAAQPTASDALTQWDAAWRVEAGASYRFSGLSVCPSQESVIAFESSATSDGQTIRSLVLWKVSSDGRVLAREGVVLDPTQTPGSHTIVTSSHVLASGDILLVANIDAGRRALAARISANGEVVWSVGLGVADLSDPHGFVANASGSMVVFGRHYEDAAAVGLDAEGTVLWKKHYDKGQQEEFWSGTTLPGDSHVYVAGTTGQTNEFGIGDLNVWLARINPRDGSIDKEVVFPGRTPQLASTSHSQIIVAYDTSSESLKSSRVVTSLSLAFEQQWTTRSTSPRSQCPCRASPSVPTTPSFSQDGPTKAFVCNASTGTVLSSGPANMHSVALSRPLRLSPWENRSSSPRSNARGRTQNTSA